MADWIDRWPGEGNAIDAIDTADGALVGETGFATGFIGQRFTLDGVDSAVHFGDDVANLGQGDFTIAFAIRASPFEGPQDVLAKRSLCSPSTFWHIRSRANGSLSFEIYESGSSTNGGTSTNVRDDTFHTVVMVREGTTLSAYIDGRLESVATHATISDPSSPAVFGVSNGPCQPVDGTQPFQGMIDEIRIADNAEPYLLLGDFECGDGARNGGVAATDALAALRAAVGSGECPDCICDVKSVGGITATDALQILRFGVGQPLSLLCPDCEF